MWLYMCDDAERLYDDNEDDDGDDGSDGDDGDDDVDYFYRVDPNRLP